PLTRHTPYTPLFRSVDADPVRGELAGEPLREVVDARLGHAVRKHFGERRARRNGRDVDDRTAPPSLDHVRTKDLAGEKHALEVRSEEHTSELQSREK